MDSILKALLLLFLMFALVPFWYWNKLSLPIYQPTILKKQRNVLTSHQDFDILQLKKDWCRVKDSLIAWREIVSTCQEMPIDFKQNKKYATAPEVSKVIANIKAAGEYTNLRIDTFYKNNIKKSIGGDSYRVMFRGKEEVVSATVFDLRNGSYDALALITKPGRYKIQVILDYTQCFGIKDPPVGWFSAAHCLTRHVDQEARYINKEVLPGLIVTIPSPKYNLTLLQYYLHGVKCGFQCRQVWDGHGSWQKSVPDTNQWFWKQTIPNLKKEGKMRRRRVKRSTMWIYGDSLSMFFFKRLQSTELCKNIFKSCVNTYNWVYPRHLYEKEPFCKEKDIDIEKLRKYFKEAINGKDMDSHSVLMLNVGVHMTKNVSFQKYKDIINMLIKELQNYKGKMIWKSTTAIHKQDTSTWHRRYTTNHRAQLYNAYANSMICSSNLTVLDIYPLTSSYPFGTRDGVHFDDKNTFPQMINMLIDYFK